MDRRAHCLAPELSAFIARMRSKIRSPAPHALQELRRERGDIRALEGVLAGYYRLRVGRFRIIFAYAADGAIEAVFMEERSLVYEVVEAEFIKRLKS